VALVGDAVGGLFAGIGDGRDEDLVDLGDVAHAREHVVDLLLQPVDGERLRLELVLELLQPRVGGRRRRVLGGRGARGGHTQGHER
jgi:hypothetical protein